MLNFMCFDHISGFVTLKGFNYERKQYSTKQVADI